MTGKYPPLTFYTNTDISAPSLIKSSDYVYEIWQCKLPSIKTLLFIIFDQVLSNRPSLCRLVSVNECMIPKNTESKPFFIFCSFALHALFQNWIISTETIITVRTTSVVYWRTKHCAEVFFYLHRNTNCFDTEPKWPSFYRLHFKMHFGEWQLLYFD